MDASRKLLAIKAFHTLVWAFFAACIVAIPLAVSTDNLRLAALLIALVLIEVVIIAFNRGSCPLTAVAARYTSDRADNFDIFLPVWLARYNKAIFGILFVGGLVYALVAWAAGRGGRMTLYSNRTRFAGRLSSGARLHVQRTRETG